MKGEYTMNYPKISIVKDDEKTVNVTKEELCEVCDDNVVFDTCDEGNLEDHGVTLMKKSDMERDKINYKIVEDSMGYICLIKTQKK
jgi:hypothetical protein